MEKEKPRIDYSRLPEPLRQKLAEWEKNSPGSQQLEALNKLTPLVEKMVKTLERTDSADKQAKLLGEIRTVLEAIRAKKAPEAPKMPDYAGPVVDAVQRLEARLTAAVAAIDVKPEAPQVHVPAPNVTVGPAPVDLGGVEKALKTDVPKAFKSAIAEIPRPIPTDTQPLLRQLKEITEQLVSIDMATRMKPRAPTKIHVTNADGSDINSVAQPSSKTVPFTTAIVAPIAVTDCSGFNWVSVHIVTQGSSSTVNFQVSNDGANWASLMLMSSTNIGDADPSSSATSANLVMSGALHAKYFRLNVTGISAGVTSGVILFSGQDAASIGATRARISALVPGTTATSLGKAEDAGHNTGDTGVAMWGVRNDAQTTLTNADTDYSPIATDGPGNSRVVGNVDAAATDAGSPVKVGGKYNSTLPTYTNGQRGDLGIGTRGAALVQLMSPDSSNAMPTVVTNSDTIAVGSLPSRLEVVTRNTALNGTTYDRVRINEDVTLLASASRTTTQTSADIVNYNGISALVVVLDMTVVGTGSVTLSIDGKDGASGKYYNILTGAAVITNSTNVYRVGPDLAVAANLTAQDYLPRTFRIVVTANNGNAATYSVGYSLMRN